MIITAFQVLEWRHSDQNTILRPGKFLQRLQKFLRGCKSVLEVSKMFQRLEFFQRPFGTVLKALKEC